MKHRYAALLGVTIGTSVALAYFFLATGNGIGIMALMVTSAIMVTATLEWHDEDRP